MFGSGSDTYAEYAVLTAWAPKPRNVSFEEAAGFPTPLETATRIVDAVALRPGRTLLVNGASGGVGSVAVQLAVHRGLKVIGRQVPPTRTTSSRWARRPRRTTKASSTVCVLAPDGVDAALDVAGSGVIPELVELTRDASVVISIADFGAPRHGARVSTGFGADKSPALRDGARLVESGVLALPVERTFPLSEAARAQAASAKGHVRGRLVVTVP